MHLVAMILRCLPLMVCFLVAESVMAEDASPVQRAKERALDEFTTGYQVLAAIYRNRMGDLLAQGTRVEICLLDFSLGKEERDTPAKGMFRIAPYNKETAILASHLCTESEREQILPLLRQAVSGVPSIGGFACHFPIHGIRVWIGDELAFQTSICWYCGNWQMDYGRGAAWENLTSGFYDLKPALLKLMPIPDDEIQRFKKDHDGPPQGQ